MGKKNKRKRENTGKDEWERWENGTGIASAMQRKKRVGGKARKRTQKATRKPDSPLVVAVKLGEELSTKPQVAKEKQQFAKKLRKEMTAAELHFLQSFVKAIKIKIASQVVVCGYVVDFLLPTVKLVIEIDGSSHNFQQKYDAARTGHLEKAGYKVVRFSNHRVLAQMPEVIAEMRRVLNLPEPTKVFPSMPFPKKKRGLSIEQVWAMTAKTTQKDKEKV